MIAHVTTSQRQLSRPTILLCYCPYQPCHSAGRYSYCPTHPDRRWLYLSRTTMPSCWEMKLLSAGKWSYCNRPAIWRSTLQNWGHSLSPDKTWRMLEATGCAHTQSSILYPPSYTLLCSPPHVPTLLHPPSISPSPCVHPPHVSTLQHPCIQVTCVTS